MTDSDTDTGHRGLKPIDCEALEARLQAAGVSVARLCRAADVSPSTWHRLKTGDSQAAQASTRERLLAAADRLLAAVGHGDSSGSEAGSSKADAA
jgi:hypothetical protein